MEKIIVVTTVNPPGKGLSALAAIADYSLLVVGDRKTCEGWHCQGARYISPLDQEKLPLKLPSLLPWNHYSRKMIGYLAAVQDGAAIIYDTDDDNIPKLDWHFPRFSGNFLTTVENLGFVNIYRYFCDMDIWPRGFDLRRINDPSSRIADEQLSNERVEVGIWQGLADGDPDVDAIYRLTNNTPCYFLNRDPIVLNRGVISPVNSQNTLFRSEIFHLLYLPCTVSFRFTDILRGLVAQPILWALNMHVGVTRATVVQERNAHDLLHDFEDEIPCYLLTQRVIDTVTRSIRSSYTLSENLHQAYEALYNRQIVKRLELEVLEAWLADLEEATKAPRSPGD